MKSLTKVNDFVYVYFSEHNIIYAFFKKYFVSLMKDLILILLKTTSKTNIRYFREVDLTFLIKQLIDKDFIVTFVLNYYFSESIMRDDSSACYLKYDF